MATPTHSSPDLEQPPLPSTTSLSHEHEHEHEQQQLPQPPAVASGTPVNMALFERSSVPKIRRTFESRSASVSESKDRERLLHEQAAKRRQLNLHTGRALSDAATLRGAVSVPLSPADISSPSSSSYSYSYSSASSPLPPPHAAETALDAERKLRDSLRALWESLSCVCCYQSLSCMVTLPCAHMCLCQFCCAKVDSCPLCRVKIESSMLVHCQWDALKLEIDW